MPDSPLIALYILLALASNSTAGAGILPGHSLTSLSVAPTLCLSPWRAQGGLMQQPAMRRHPCELREKGSYKILIL